MSESEQKKPTIWQVISSVLGAFLGVQSSQVRERDFAKGNPWAFILIGIVATVIFVLTLFGVVRWVLSSVGKG
ncbi:MAG: DUF2970 domain-containing protein [Candidatus Berkiella sp.]